MLSYYRQHYGGDHNKASRHLKEDLNNMVVSEALTKQAKAPLSMFLARLDVRLTHFMEEQKVKKANTNGQFIFIRNS